MPELSGSSNPLEVAAGGYTLQAPGMTGSISEVDPQVSVTRGEGGMYESNLMAAIGNANIAMEKMFVMEVNAEASAEPVETTRAAGLVATTREGEAAMVFGMPSLGDNVGYVVLYTDEAGVSRWIFPEAGATTAAATRGGGSDVVFHLPLASAPLPPGGEDEAATRGPISQLGRRLVRVLTWVTDDLVGQGALAVVTQWEKQNRPYGFHLIEPDTYQLPNPRGAPVAWDLIRQGRTLLFIHGTFSSAEASFAQIPKATLKQLAQIYQGRIIAFNHPSLYHSPTQNVQTFLDMLPDKMALDLDIVTHSRGGLVGRELTERLGDVNLRGRKITVRKALLMASPNQGTILADGEHGMDLVDRYTNLLTFLPDNAYTLILEGLLAVVKLLFHGTVQGVPGVSCLNPRGDYLRRLNTSPAHRVTYYALTADFMPDAPGLLARFWKRVEGKLVDSVFGEANDSVVPTRGSYEAGPNSPGFPIPPERRVIYGKETRVNHSAYFSNAAANQQIVAWLSK